MSFNDVFAKSAAPATTGFASVFSSAPPAQEAEQENAGVLDQQTEAARQTADNATPFSELFNNPDTGILPAIKTAVGGYITKSIQQVKNIGSQIIENPVAAAEKGVNFLQNGVPDAIGSAALTGFKGGKSNMDSLISGNTGTGDASTAENVANVARLAGNVSSILFSPISGSFAAAEKVPVLKQFADALNIPFSITGIAAAYATGKIIDIIPDSILSQKSKDILKGPLGDLASTAAQVFVGGDLMSRVGDLAKTGKPITPADAEAIVAQTKAQHPTIFEPQDTIAPTSDEPVAVGNEPVLPDGVAKTPEMEDLHTQMGQKISDAVEAHAAGNPALAASLEKEYNDMIPKYNALAKEAETATPTTRTPKEISTDIIDTTNALESTGTKLADISTIQKDGMFVPKSDATVEQKGFVTKIEGLRKELIAAKEVPTPVEKLKPLDFGKENVSGLAKKIQEDAISAGLKGEYGELPMYNHMDMAEQARMANDLIEKNPEQALRVAKFEELSPNPALLPEMVSSAFRIKAIKGEISPDIIRELGTSKSLAEHAARLGQGIKAFDTGLNSDPVKLIQDVKKARLDAIDKKTMTKEQKEIADDIKKELKRQAVDDKEWSDFIKQIQCQ